MNEIKLRDSSAPLSFVQITDTHLLDDADALMHGINTRDTLEAVLQDAWERYRDLDFILITGDISQTGSSQSYVHFKSAIGRCNIPMYAVPGNHDTPGLLQQVIPVCPDGAIKTVNLGNITLVLLSSHVAESHGGMISALQLQQLDSLLHGSNARHHVIAIHHPPVLVYSRWLDALGLINREELLEVIFRHEQQTLILCGHVHQQIDQQMQNIRLLATPSTCYQFVARSETMQREEQPQPAYRYIRLDSTRDIYTEVHTIDWTTNYQASLRVQNL